VSGKELCRILERHGWRLQRIKGSHHIYSRPDHEAILTVPVHGNHDLKRGTLHSILKQSGLTEMDL
jgi:predicted RNA binding protein YcfA (HicA-like mRNA interferase family)